MQQYMISWIGDDSRQPTKEPSLAVQVFRVQSVRPHELDHGGAVHHNHLWHRGLDRHIHQQDRPPAALWKSLHKYATIQPPLMDARTVLQKCRGETDLLLRARTNIHLYDDMRPWDSQDDAVPLVEGNHVKASARAFAAPCLDSHTFQLRLGAFRSAVMCMLRTIEGCQNWREQYLLLSSLIALLSHHLLLRRKMLIQASALGEGFLNGGSWWKTRVP